MSLVEARDRLAALLARNKVKIVFAESCTGGLACATMTQVAGISQYLCGSAAVYRPDTKQRWLDVDAETIQRHSCESQPVVDAMAINVLRKTPEADWSAAIVGRLQDEPWFWIGLARRTAGGGVQLADTQTGPLQTGTRIQRQAEATTKLLEELALAIAAAG